jgi:hypothetical protein
MISQAATLVVLAVTLGVLIILGAIADWREARASRVEAELDRAERELRVRIFTLASQLSAEAHDARKALIRESFLAGQSQVDPRKR